MSAKCGCGHNGELVVLGVKGMTCGHCKAAVEKALGEIPGVSFSKVNLEDGIVTIGFDSNVVGLDSIRGAITEAGYEVMYK